MKIDLQGLKPTVTQRVMWLHETVQVYGYINAAHVMRRFKVSMPTALDTINLYKKRGGALSFHGEYQFYYVPGFPHTLDIEATTFVGDTATLVISGKEE
jgi:hypothetical protein